MKMKRVQKKIQRLLFKLINIIIILGTVDVEFDENGIVIGQVGELIAIADKEEDPEVAEALKEYSIKLTEVKNESIGATTVA